MWRLYCRTAQKPSRTPRCSPPCWPSLYVDIDEAAWAELPHVHKWRQVEQVAELAGPKGYDGVLLRTEGGRPLAQWLRGRGIALIDGSALTAGRDSAQPARMTDSIPSSTPLQ